VTRSHGEEGGFAASEGHHDAQLLSRSDAACLAVADGIGHKALALYAATAPRLSIVFEPSSAGIEAPLSLGTPAEVLASARRTRDLVLDATEAAEADAREQAEVEAVAALAKDNGVLRAGSVARRAIASAGASPARSTSGLSTASGGTSTVAPLADFAPRIAVSAHAVLGLKASGLAAVVDPDGKILQHDALRVLGSESGIERDSGSRVWA